MALRRDCTTTETATERPVTIAAGRSHFTYKKSSKLLHTMNFRYPNDKQALY